MKIQVRHAYNDERIIIMSLIKGEEAFYQEAERIISPDLVKGSTPPWEQGTV
jgi:hypothetical protein